MQLLMSRMRAAMEKYNMISAGDTVAVGVSGGKDSLALLSALAGLRRFYPIKFDVVAITVDMGFGGQQSDFPEIEKLCKKIGVNYYVKHTQLAKVIFDDRKESNPCSLCARMRRGILHDFAKECGCNKLALGHHMDDAVETFMMNLLFGGNIGSFRPVTYLSRKDIYVIRPMIFATEKEVAQAAVREGLPVVKSRCPNDGVSERQETKELIATLEKKYPHLREKIIGALQRGEISGW